MCVDSISSCQPTAPSYLTLLNSRSTITSGVDVSSPPTTIDGPKCTVASPSSMPYAPRSRWSWVPAQPSLVCCSAWFVLSGQVCRHDITQSQLLRPQPYSHPLGAGSCEHQQLARQPPFANRRVTTLPGIPEQIFMPLRVSWTVPLDRFFHFIHLAPFSTLAEAVPAQVVQRGSPWPIMDCVGTTFSSSHAPIG